MTMQNDYIADTTAMNAHFCTHFGQGSRYIAKSLDGTYVNIYPQTNRERPYSFVDAQESQNDFLNQVVNFKNSNDPRDSKGWGRTLNFASDVLADSMYLYTSGGRMMVMVADNYLRRNIVMELIRMLKKTGWAFTAVNSAMLNGPHTSDTLIAIKKYGSNDACDLFYIRVCCGNGFVIDPPLLTIDHTPNDKFLFNALDCENLERSRNNVYRILAERIVPPIVDYITYANEPRLFLPVIRTSAEKIEKDTALYYNRLLTTFKLLVRNPHEIKTEAQKRDMVFKEGVVYENGFDLTIGTYRASMPFKWRKDGPSAVTAADCFTVYPFHRHVQKAGSMPNVLEGKHCPNFLGFHVNDGGDIDIVIPDVEIRAGFIYHLLKSLESNGAVFTMLNTDGSSGGIKTAFILFDALYCLESDNGLPRTVLTITVSGSPNDPYSSVFRPHLMDRLCKERITEIIEQSATSLAGCFSNAMCQFICSHSKERKFNTNPIFITGFNLNNMVDVFLSGTPRNSKEYVHENGQIEVSCRKDMDGSSVSEAKTLLLGEGATYQRGKATMAGGEMRPFAGHLRSISIKPDLKGIDPYPFEKYIEVAIPAGIKRLSDKYKDKLMGALGYSKPVSQTEKPMVTPTRIMSKRFQKHLQKAKVHK